MDPRTRIIKRLIYLVKISLAAAVFLTLLLILAILTEFYAEFDRERTLVGNLSHLFAVPGIGWRLIRDTLPGILAAGGALFLASNFIASLYESNSWREGTEHILRCVFGQSSFAPFMRVEGGKVDAKVSDDVLARIGGPGSILVYNDSAVVLERGGRLTRMLRPGQFGFGLLQPFEKVYDVIDVRPMRWEYAVSALSKEGIPVTVYADVKFQIDTGGRDPTDRTPYPALDEAILRASTCRWMRDPEGSEDDQYFDWARRMIISETEGSLRGIIARYPLDALIGLDDTSDSPRKDIQEKLTEALRRSAASLGAQINEVQLGTIKVEDKVTGQWLEAWWNDWQGWAMTQEKRGEARREQLRERAKAQAQAEMIIAVAKAFQEPVSKDVHLPPRLLCMRLIEILNRSAIEPNLRIYMSRDAIKTLEDLRKLVSQ